MRLVFVIIITPLIILLSACSKDVPDPPAAASTLQLQAGSSFDVLEVASFEGLGYGFEGPQGTSTQRNPSDNALAVGPEHVIQTVNTRTAIFSKTGEVLYGPVENNNFFRGFGGPCEDINNGDTVVRYDQLAQRWLVVMPIFRRLPRREHEPPVPTPEDGPVLLGDDKILAWNYHVDWDNIENTRLEGPVDIPVDPYAYLCGGQLTRCVPQPGTDERLDAQGDKLMARVTYRRRGDQESVVAAHSVAVGFTGSIEADLAPEYGDQGFNPSVGGGVRWYEFRIDPARSIALYQQGTYAPGVTPGDSVDAGPFRWLPSPAIDSHGNIGIGYSWGSAHDFAGQRFAARSPSDSLGQLGSDELVLATGRAPQDNTLRWEDYTQTAIDPTDDCTIWYVGDHYKAGATAYSTRISAVRMPGCGK